VKLRRVCLSWKTRRKIEDENRSRWSRGDERAWKFGPWGLFRSVLLGGTRKFWILTKASGNAHFNVIIFATPLNLFIGILDGTISARKNGF
jgi:hypothetical protein